MVKGSYSNRRAVTCPCQGRANSLREGALTDGRRTRGCLHRARLATTWHLVCTRRQLLDARYSIYLTWASCWWGVHSRWWGVHTRWWGVHTRSLLAERLCTPSSKFLCVSTSISRLHGHSDWWTTCPPPPAPPCSYLVRTVRRCEHWVVSSHASQRRPRSYVLGRYT